MSNTEHVVQKAVQNALKKIYPKAFIAKYSAGQYTTRGVPDLLCCIHGYFIAIEVKTDTGRLSELQKMSITRIEESEGLAITVYGINGITEMMEIIDEFIS